MPGQTVSSTAPCFHGFQLPRYPLGIDGALVHAAAGEGAVAAPQVVLHCTFELGPLAKRLSYGTALAAVLITQQANQGEEPIQQVQSAAQPESEEGSGSASRELLSAQAGILNVSNPRIVADSSMVSGQVATWDCVWFGSYPQTEIEQSDAVYSTLVSASWNTIGDATIDGTVYRRVSRSDVTYDGYWPEDSAEYRYFKYEPIKWRVLSAAGDEAFVVADVALDSRKVREGVYNDYGNNPKWETSPIRSWLNGYGASANESGVDYSSNNFLAAAFSSSEQGAIQATDVVNSDNSSDGTDGGSDTVDDVFLLSEDEVYGNAAAAYGFAVAEDVWDEGRRCKATDFAHAMGADRQDGASEYPGNCIWWLRSPTMKNSGYSSACKVWYYGLVDIMFGKYGDSYAGIRPALTLDLSSAPVSGAGTVSSNGDVNEQAPAGGLNPARD